MANVTKRDLVEKIAEKTGLTQVDTKIVVESFLESVSKSLEEGQNIEIRGFGRFKVKEKKARIARNPRTNEHVEVEAGYKPVFEASRELRKKMNETAKGTESDK
ncbi:MAG: HU family DNA-binding protein [Fibrobacter sp.]|nr:HU family DNA-binding protein [Fibrobacter sp.]